MSTDFDDQIASGLALPFSGWDFSPIASRYRQGNPPWDYASLLREKFRETTSLLDLGTGGGEFLASLAPLPRAVFATEGYPPNLPIASAHLEPLGVRVMPIESDLRIPLSDESMDLVASRHEEFLASEVFRVLAPGGWFITQQVGLRNNLELREKFSVDAPRPTNRVSGSAELASEITEAGFVVVKREEATFPAEFLDLGALVFYLRAIPWEVPGFSVERHRGPLGEIYREIQSTGSFSVTTHRLLVVARRPERGP